MNSERTFSSQCFAISFDSLQTIYSKFSGFLNIESIKKALFDYFIYLFITQVGNFPIAA